jgi:hypothetical protein
LGQQQQVWLLLLLLLVPCLLMPSPLVPVSLLLLWWARALSQLWSRQPLLQLVTLHSNKTGTVDAVLADKKTLVKPPVQPDCTALNQLVLEVPCRPMAAKATTCLQKHLLEGLIPKIL